MVADGAAGASGGVGLGSQTANELLYFQALQAVQELKRGSGGGGGGDVGGNDASEEGGSGGDAEKVSSITADVAKVSAGAEAEAVASLQPAASGDGRD